MQLKTIMINGKEIQKRGDTSIGKADSLCCTAKTQHWKATILRKKENLNLKNHFPGGPMAKTPHSQCRGPRFNPWSEN